MSRRTLLTALALAAALAGCPGSLDDPGRFNAQFGIDGGGGSAACPDVPTFLSTTCATAGCHVAPTLAGSLDLATAGVFTRLSGKMAKGGAGLLIDPAEPDASVLYTKLTSTPPFGTRMPLTGGPLDDPTLACVLTWIEKGSP